MRNFKKFEIWKQGIEIVKMIYIIAKQLPKEEMFGLRSQITRAAVSVPSNIAEGAGRNTDKDFKRFLEIALGSLFEIETQLILIKELELIENLEVKEIFALIEKEGKQINSFINKLK
ncbi:MAG: four helix bundle protein [Chitinophagales bacterium]